MEPEDATIVAECLGGNRAAFEILVARYERRVWNVARRMVGKAEDAQDIAQNVFLKVFENLGSFDPAYPFRAWITRIAVNESLNFLQQRRPSDPLPDDRPSGELGPGELVNALDLSRAVERALRRLSPDYRAVVVLRYFLDLSYREMATVLEVPEKTVKSRLFTSRQLLREALAGQGALEA